MSETATKTRKQVIFVCSIQMMYRAGGMRAVKFPDMTTIWSFERSLVEVHFFKLYLLFEFAFRQG